MPQRLLHNPEPSNQEVRDALWLNLTASHPHWKERGADFTPIGIKSLVEIVAGLAFVAGVKRGRADQVITTELSRRRRENYRNFLLHLDKHLGAPDLGQEETGDAGDAHARSA